MFFFIPNKKTDQISSLSSWLGLKQMQMFASNQSLTSMRTTNSLGCSSFVYPVYSLMTSQKMTPLGKNTIISCCSGIRALRKTRIRVLPQKNNPDLDPNFDLIKLTFYFFLPIYQYHIIPQFNEYCKKSLISFYYFKSCCIRIRPNFENRIRIRPTNPDPESDPQPWWI